jgi:hypothetical protein
MEVTLIFSFFLNAMILWVFIFKIIPKERIKTAKAISILLQESKCFVLK